MTASDTVERTKYQRDPEKVMKARPERGDEGRTGDGLSTRL
jgi:hypothetical protein